MRFYQFLSANLRGLKHRVVVDVTMALATGYFLVTRVSEISVSALLAGVFQPNAVENITMALAVLVGYTVVAKAALLILDAFPATRVRMIDSDGLAHCCLRIIEEIKRHTLIVLRDPKRARRSFLENHNFDVNTSLVIECLHKHIVETLQGARGRDIFVSLYSVPRFPDDDAPRDKLEYQTHQPIKRDVVVSKSIGLADEAYSEYECVKCICAGKSTHLLLDSSRYYRSDVKRHKNIRHYIGMKLSTDDLLIGFLNVELYDKAFFATEDEMIEYVEQQILPFRYLLEYQFLKRRFFAAVDANLLREAH